MTDQADMTQHTDIPVDKLFEHHRQQLSAMLDGELAPDQAKFMLRRLQHDTELATCWERWQVCGDILRGRHDALLPADFSQRVTRAISGDEIPASVATASTATTSRQPKWLRWGSGAALAASVAMLALLVTRQAPDLESPSRSQAVTVAASNISTVDAAGSEAATPGKTAPSVPEIATTLATAVAVAELPRRATDRRSRAQSQRAASRVRQRQAAPVMVAVANATKAKSPPLHAPGVLGTAAMAANTAANTATHVADPFATHGSPPSRPWPRAIGPSFPANATFTASYGSTDSATSTHPFHPFEPRAFVETDAQLPSTPIDGQRSSGPR